MTNQDTQWKEAYDQILAENEALKSAGSKARLASEWRQRHDAVLAECEDLKNRLRMQQESAALADAAKYETKYRDLKESFRLYRKKAKEIFEAQSTGKAVVSLFGKQGALIRFDSVSLIDDSMSPYDRLHWCKRFHRTCPKNRNYAI